MAHISRVFISVIGLAGGLAWGIACGGSEDDGGADGGGACVAGQQSQCACPGGGSGVQVCLDGASFGPCDCSGVGDDTGGETEGEEDTSDDNADADAGMEGTTGDDACGNGVEDPGECPDACPQDCSGVDGSTSIGGADTTTGVDNCEDAPIYATMIPNVPSVWEFGGIEGFGAGNMMCANAMADTHVCDYEEVLLADAAGEFAAMAAGTTAWIHRTTPAMVDAVMSPPGVGGRCVDWTYPTNHISDGEFVTFGAGGATTYSLDNDTMFDEDAPAPNPHVQMGLLECGGQMRAILCCFPECEPEG